MNDPDATAEDHANAEKLRVQSEAFAAQFLGLIGDDGANLGIVVASAVSAAVATAMAAGLNRDSLEELFTAMLDEFEDTAKDSDGA